MIFLTSLLIILIKKLKLEIIYHKNYKRTNVKSLLFHYNFLFKDFLF